MFLKSRPRRLLPLWGVVLGWGVLSVLAGCQHEEVPVSPNAKTAAPARLPGEDPHAPPTVHAPPGMHK